MQFSLTPYSGAMTFFINFYRIAAYDKQIRCLAYAQGSTFEVRWAVLSYSGSASVQLLSERRPRQVGQLDQRQGSVQALPLLLQAALGATLPVILLVGLEVL